MVMRMTPEEYYGSRLQSGSDPVAAHGTLSVAEDVPSPDRTLHFLIFGGVVVAAVAIVAIVALSRR